MHRICGGFEPFNVKVGPLGALGLLTSLACAPTSSSVLSSGAPSDADARLPSAQPAGTVEGIAIDRYTLSNSKGMQVEVITLGATVTRILVPDRSGRLGDVALGFDQPGSYLEPGPYFGAVVGRYANRIAKGRFALDGKPHALAVNNGPNSLHGGLRGFDKRVWTARPMISSGGASSVELRYVSKDGEEGYPGTLAVQVTYAVTEDNELRIDYLLTAEQDTIANVTNHTYFNLAGHGRGDITKHEIQIRADRFTPVDETLIPTGELRPVAGTPLDLTRPTLIGAGIDADDEQMRFGGGYDHNFVVSGAPGVLRPAARVTESSTGRVLEVTTTEPGVQFYSGNFLDGVKGKDGMVYPRRSGFCLETQHFPDSPNQPSFPSTVIKAGQPYRSTTVYRFSAR